MVILSFVGTTGDTFWLIMQFEQLLLLFLRHFITGCGALKGFIWIAASLLVLFIIESVPFYLTLCIWGLPGIIRIGDRGEIVSNLELIMYFNLNQSIKAS